VLGRPAARPARLRARHVRGLAAAVIAVAALVGAANAGPSGTTAPEPVEQVTAQDR
jgi:hypothetical protein